ncbi:MAG: DASS family sodium-coupled anion symporter [Robiginitomaculum sp.]|nr:DASS family sodium-coupled anion symporter [Robiginitomaculum sp.]MDQ7077249.1 DASS family sodium-coupled anion symporter [Robiginitomaculum sp.]
MPTNVRKTYQSLGLIAGPLAAILLGLFFAPDDLEPAGRMTAAMAVWMAIWWASEAVPFAVTALLPLVFFPILGINNIKATSAPYANPMIYLFMGGFIVARAIEHWDLHRRMALNIFTMVGTHARALVGGIMVAAALISMWISNTATSLMLLPIATSIVAVVMDSVDGLTETQKRNFGITMVLGLAYGATIGGVATLVGTPPNAFLASFLDETMGIEIGFGQWMLVGVPVSLTLLPLGWLVLTRFAYPVNFTASEKTQVYLHNLKNELGPITSPQKRVAMIFVALALAWALRKPITTLTGLGGLSDTGIAIFAAILIFMVPSGDPKQRSLLTWEQAAKLPWGILILFGGGLSLAASVSSSGLAVWLGNSLSGLGVVHFALLVIAATALVIFLTELTSNLATIATFLPVMTALAVALDQDVLLLAVPVALAASCAFMLPIATPPNAIAFSSNMVTIPNMARAGFLLNLIAIALLFVVAITLVPLVFG